MRNPWSEVEWKGDWNDNSYLWTEGLKHELGLESKDDGVFFISFADYAQFFYMTTICKYVDEHTVSTCSDEHPPPSFSLQTFTL